MNEKVYQVLCRNINLCASSMWASYKALNNPTEHNIDIALIASIIKLEDYSANLSKSDSLNMLLNAEGILKEIISEASEPSQL